MKVDLALTARGDRHWRAGLTEKDSLRSDELEQARRKRRAEINSRKLNYERGVCVVYGTKACVGSFRRKRSKWRGTACKPRNRKANGRFSAGVRESNNQASFAMRLTPEIGRFHGGALAPRESKFDEPEIGHLRETKLCAHFGRKLQTIFPLPSTNSEPENVRTLLHKIQAKLDKPPLPGDG